MKIALALLALVGSCSPIQPIADDIEKIADDNILTIKVEKEALQKDTDVKINVEVINKDAPK